jgi:hypothetical protein
LLTIKQYVQLSEVFYILTTTTLKISLGLFFLRILSKRWQTQLFHAILTVSATYGLFYALSTIFACGDPRRIADAYLGSKQCRPSGFVLATGYIYGVINIIADWTFVLIPISVLIGSDLDRRSKISVSIVMALGAVGSISSILRMVYLKGLLLGSHGLGSTHPVPQRVSHFMADTDSQLHQSHHMRYSRAGNWNHRGEHRHHPTSDPQHHHFGPHPCLTLSLQQSIACFGR